MFLTLKKTFQSSTELTATSERFYFTENSNNASDGRNDKKFQAKKFSRYSMTANETNEIKMLFESSSFCSQK